MRFLSLFGLLLLGTVGAEERVIDAGLHHLRDGEPREWSEFPEAATKQSLTILFSHNAENAEEQTLALRQQDVKQPWRVLLNGRELGQLTRDENDMRVYFVVPPKSLAAGENALHIESMSSDTASPDDIRVGDISLVPQSLEKTLSEATVQVTVVDEQTSRPLPARISIFSERGSLQTVRASESRHIAARPGTLYTATGNAEFGLPAGSYRITAGRGFEYSLATDELMVESGNTARIELMIRREVPTDGYVACDTHIHTLTHSGHGDATIEERLVTIAAEGIELPIATDHNKHVDYEPLARDLGVREHFTPVMGNEVTTPVGHFNIFPVPADARVPKHELRDWDSIFQEIEQSVGGPVVILNHARDLHSGVRPFGPRRFNATVAESLEGWPIRINGMEVINSGATQTDTMQLLRDWMSLLNRGLAVAPVGSSDSHDVARHFVGQGRTYIRCDDSDPAAIDVNEAVESFRLGRVMVSYGLLAEIEVDGQGSGNLVATSGENVTVKVRVLGPHWTAADRVELFANGEPLGEREINASDAEGLSVGVKWQGKWTLAKPAHDMHLVAIARGPGVDAGYWKTAKPYQPTSPDWEPQVIGCSGAIWLDADGDGQQTSARGYAEKLVEQAAGDLPRLLNSLAPFDAVVASHAAYLHHKQGHAPDDPQVQEALKSAAPAVRDGFGRYFRSWRDSVIERAE